MNQKLSPDTLRYAGLMLASLSGHDLRRKPGVGQLYLDGRGNPVRLRTSNDRCLVTSASDPDPDRASLDLEQNEDVLLVMPTTKRGTGAIEAYRVPGDVAVRAVLGAHKTWLATNPSTKGKDQTFVIWFDEAVAESGMFREKWKQYRLPIELQIKVTGGET